MGQLNQDLDGSYIAADGSKYATSDEALHRNNMLDNMNAQNSSGGGFIGATQNVMGKVVAGVLAVTIGAFVLQRFFLYIFCFGVYWIYSFIILRKGRSFIAMLALFPLLVLAIYTPYNIYKYSVDPISLSREKITDPGSSYHELKVFINPNLKGEEVTTLEVGEEVELFGMNRSRKAFRIKTIDGKIGWIDRYILPNDAAIHKPSIFGDDTSYPKAYERQKAELKAGKTFTVSEATKIYAEPEDFLEDARVIKTLKKGDTLTITGDEVHKHFFYYPVVHNGDRGFVTRGSILSYDVTGDKKNAKSYLLMIGYLGSTIALLIYALYLSKEARAIRAHKKRIMKMVKEAESKGDEGLDELIRLAKEGFDDAEFALIRIAYKSPPEVHYKVGVFFYEKDGNTAELEKSAKRGCADAQYYMGFVREKSSKQHDLEAKDAVKWYLKAAAQGHKEAAEWLKANEELVNKTVSGKKAGKIGLIGAVLGIAISIITGGGFFKIAIFAIIGYFVGRFIGKIISKGKTSA